MYILNKMFHDLHKDDFQFKYWTILLPLIKVFSSNLILDLFTEHKVVLL